MSSGFGGRGVQAWALGVLLGLVGCSLSPFPNPAATVVGGAGGDATSTGGLGLGGTGGTSSGGMGGSGAVALHPEGYTYRMEIFIEAESPLPAGHAVAVEIDHAALVGAGKALEDGRDLHLFRAEEEGWEEHTRVLDPASSWNETRTTLWFALTENLAGDKKERQFYLYYGNPGAMAPPDDPNDVYEFWSFEESLDASWTSTTVGTGAFDVNVDGGVVTLTAQSGAIGGTADDFGFLHRLVSGDFVLDAHHIAAGGSIGAAATLGGTMVRAADAADSRHAVYGPPEAGEQSFVRTHRAADGGASTITPVTLPVTLPGYTRLTRLGDTVTGHGSSDGEHWHAIGDAITFDESLDPSVRVGLALAGDAATAVWAEVDWLRIRPTVPQEPMVYAKPEQGPF